MIPPVNGEECMVCPCSERSSFIQAILQESSLWSAIMNGPHDFVILRRPSRHLCGKSFQTHRCLQRQGKSPVCGHNNATLKQTRLTKQRIYVDVTRARLLFEQSTDILLYKSCEIQSKFRTTGWSPGPEASYQQNNLLQQVVRLEWDQG